MDLPKALRALRVFHGFVEGALRQAHSLGGNADAAAIESGERDLQALAFFTEAIRRGHYAIIQNEFRRRANCAGPSCLRGGRF